MQPDATAFPPWGFDPNDPQLNLLAQRIKSHLRKPMVLTDLTTPRNVSEYSRATYVPVLDKGVPDERFGLLMRLEHVYKFRIDFGCLWCCQWENLATAEFPERSGPHTIPVCDYFVDMSRWPDACRGQ